MDECDIGATARRLLGRDIAVSTVNIARINGVLFPQERAAMRRAVPRRVREFTAGRCAARMAMKDLGIAPVAVPMGGDRAPIWPNGILGSLSHTDKECVAAVARTSDAKAIGIDIEANTPLADDLIAVICTATERRWIDTRPTAQRGRMGKLIFSAKECAYKCQYPLTQEVIDFTAFEITIDENDIFQARFSRSVGQFPAGTVLLGGFHICQNLILTTMRISHRRKNTISD